MAGRRKMDVGEHGKINRFRLQQNKQTGAVSRMSKKDGKPVVSEGCKALERWEAECRYKGPDGVMRRAKRVSPVGQDGKSHDRTGSDAVEALVAAVKESTKVNATAQTERDSRLVDQLAEFMDMKVRNQKVGKPKARRTIDSYNRVEKVLRGESAKCVREKCSHFGHLRASDVTVAKLDKIFYKIVEAHDHTTAKQGLMLMTEVGDYLVKAEAWTINLFLGVKLPEAVDPDTPEALNLTEARQLISRLATSEVPLPTMIGAKRDTTYRTIAQYARDVDLVDPIAVALFIGLRRSELLGLLWKDYDRDKKTLTVRHHLVRAGEIAGGPSSELIHEAMTKTKRSARVISLPDEIVSLLDRRRKKFMSGDLVLAKGTPDVIFPNTAGKLRDPDTFASQWRRVRGPLLEDFKLERPEKFGLHAFRKTTASILKELGYTSVQIADILGHAQVSMTEDRYLGRGRQHPEVAAGLNAAMVGALA